MPVDFLEEDVGAAPATIDFQEEPPGTFKARASGYFPTPPDHPEHKMEGGYQDRQGNPVYTLDQFRRGKAPYVTVAMDAKAFPYDTELHSPDFPGVPFRVRDTGSAFKGKAFAKVDIARDGKAGANSAENNRAVTFSPTPTPTPPSIDFQEEQKTSNAERRTSNAERRTPNAELPQEVQQATDQAAIEQNAASLDTGPLIAAAHGAVRSAPGVGAGMALASGLEVPNAAISAFTGPAAPVTMAGLNILEFLGGMLLTNKAVEKGEKALLPHSETLRKVTQIAEEHPVAEAVGAQLPMLPLLAHSVKGFYDIAKTAETAAAATKQIGGRVAGGAAAGGIMEAARPHIETALNATGELLGFSPDEIQQPSVRTYLENMALGAALAGAGGKKAPATDQQRPRGETLKTFADLPADLATDASRRPEATAPSSEIPVPSSAEKPTPEQRAEAEYRRELEQSAIDFQEESGPELLTAIEEAGGWPSKNSPARENYRGELASLDEEPGIHKLYRKAAPNPDELATRLRDRGFTFETPDDLKQALQDRLRGGRPVYGNAIETGAPLEAIASPKTSPPTSTLDVGRSTLDVSSPKEAVAAPIPATPPPAIPPGQVMLSQGGGIPATMARTKPGSVAVPQILDSLKRVMTTAGSVGEIRSGRFNTGQARGIFKPHQEVVRLDHIDNIPTAVHETGHALQKAFYGSVKAKGLKWLPSLVRRELIGMGKALYGSRKPVAGYSGEGFAEFVRLYLTNDEAMVKRVAPATFKFFEEGVMVDHPEVATQIRAAQSLIDTYRGQGALERANRQLVRDPGWTTRTLSALKDFFTFQRQVESGTPLRELSKEAAQRGRQLAPAEDPYQLFKMKRGTAGAILERMVGENMVDVWGNSTGPGLAEVFAPVKGQRGEFMLYLFARRAQERWSKGLNPGITKEDANYLRATLERPEFVRAADGYYNWWDGLLQYLVQADPAMADAVAAIKQGSADYAPLARMIDERAVRREAASAQSNPLYRMHGSGLPVKDIFDQTLVGAARLINRANRSLVTNAVVKLASIEGMGRVIEEVPLARVRKQFNVELIRDELEKMGVDTTAIPDDEVLTYYTPAEQPKGSDPIVPHKDATGATRWYYVDPKIYDVLNKLEPFSFRNIPHVGFALDMVLGAPKRIFTLGTTGLRPSFSLLTNPLRDPQGWLLQTKAGINPAKMAAAYVRAIGEQIKAGVTGREGPLANAAYNLGAHMAQPLGRDIGQTKRASNELFHGRFMRVVRNPVDHARMLLGVPESFPRLAEFNRVADEIGWKPGTPMSPDQAVQLAIAFKEATVDFSAAGDVSRILNEAIPFYNPAIQGMRTAARAFRDHPLRTTLVGLSTFTVPTLTLWWANKDKEWYRNLPWRERYYYTNIDDGTNVWQIPRPFEWSALFQTIPESAFDAWHTQDPRAVTEAVGHIFETQNPLGYPVVLRVAKEQWQNRIDFWDRPIVPRGEEDLQPGAQIGPYTSKLAEWLGRIAPDTISPRRVDAAVRGYFGGTVPDLMDALGLGSIKKTRESELADSAIVGKLWRRGGQYNAQGQHLADFWDLKQSVDARLNAAKARLKDPSRPAAGDLDPRDAAMAPYLTIIARGNKDHPGLVNGMRVANQMRESESRRQLYRLMAAEAKQALEVWNAQKK